MPDVFDPINAQMSQASAVDRLNDFVTDLNARSSVQLWLYQTNTAPSPTNTLANFTEASFSGYGRKTIASWSATAVDPQSNAYVTSAIEVFTCSGAGVNNLIYGTVLVGTIAGGTGASATNTGSGTGYSPIFTIVAAGSGYLSPPAVRLTGAGGTGAAAHSVLSSTGTVLEIILDNAGTGYSTYPVVVDVPYELIKQNVLSTGGISMGLSTDALTTYTQLIEPANPQ